MSIRKTRDSLILNLKRLVEETAISLPELSKFTQLPNSTIYSIISGTSSDPRLSTLLSLATFFNVTLSQLIGETPLNGLEHNVPLLSWNDLDPKNGIEFTITTNTKYISTHYETKNPLFGLNIGSEISYLYKEKSIVIIEASSDFKNGDTVLISINQTSPVIKRIILDGPNSYLEALSGSIPLQKYDKDSSLIFGIIRETRILN